MIDILNQKTSTELAVLGKAARPLDEDKVALIEKEQSKWQETGFASEYFSP